MTRREALAAVAAIPFVGHALPIDPVTGTDIKWLYDWVEFRKDGERINVYTIPCAPIESFVAKVRRLWGVDVDAGKHVAGFTREREGARI